MPNTQTIIANPLPAKQGGFAQGLGKGLSQGIPQGMQSLAQGLQAHRQNIQENEAIKRLTGQDVSGLSPEMKQAFLQRITADQAKQQQQMQEKKETQSGIQTVINDMGSMIKRNLSGIGVSPLTAAGLSPEGAEHRAAFDSMRFKLESTLLPLVNKGSLAKPRFDFILSLIPKGNERQRVQVGKLRGLAKELGQEGLPIDTSVLDEIPWASEHLKSNKPFEGTKKIFGGKKITLTNPKTGKSFYPTSDKDIQEAKAAGWHVNE
jgi:hypothetical protein